MALSIVQVQSGRLALADAEGNLIGTFDDDGVLRLQVEAKLSSSVTLDPTTMLDSTEILRDICIELKRIRVLMEHLTDEKVHEHDLETRD
jgi:hypothetical protein